MKSRLKHAVDVLLTLGFLACMGYALWGEIAHEWLGLGTLLLCLAHHLLNRGWHRAVLRGRYPPARALALLVNCLLLADTAVLLYSGVLLSGHVFSCLPGRSGLALARKLHLLGSHWGFVLMGVHLGIHWGAVKGRFRFLGRAGPWLALAAAWGAAAFWRRGMPANLLLRNEFVFLRYGEAPARFYFDYGAMLCLFGFLGYWGRRFLGKRTKKRSD